MATGKFSRDKGQRGEREVIQLLQPVVNRVFAEVGREPPKLERNLMQSREGGHDLVGLEWLALEVKRHETLSVGSWWEQTKKQAGTSKVPVLFYRQNGQRSWKVMMYGFLKAGTKRVRTPVLVDDGAFVVYFENMIRHQLTTEV